MIPYTESKERPKKEASRSRLLAGSFQKQSNVQKRLVSLGYKSGSCTAGSSESKVYTEALPGFSHISSDGRGNTRLSQGRVGSLKVMFFMFFRTAFLKNCGNCGHNAHSKDREEARLTADCRSGSQ